jgi:type V secretory pathway adhesin AidA
MSQAPALIGHHYDFFSLYERFRGNGVLLAHKSDGTTSEPTYTAPSPISSMKPLTTADKPRGTSGNWIQNTVPLTSLFVATLQYFQGRPAKPLDLA